MSRRSSARRLPVVLTTAAGSVIVGAGLITDAQAAESQIGLSAGAVAPLLSGNPDKLLAALPDTFTSKSAAAAAFRAAASPETAQPVATPVPAEPARPAGTTPSGWYTPVAKYYFSARFGVPGSWSSGYHTGLDFVTKQGTPVRAATDGVVVSAEYEGAYGNIVRIKVAPGVQIWMAHLEGVKVAKGDRVEAGEVIGRVGMTGRTSGPHCHFEVRVKDKAVNPEKFFWPDGHPVKRQK